MKTLWTSSSGSDVALYELESALNRNPEAVVCEQGSKRTLIRLPPDTFQLVTKNELDVFNLNDRSTPGWYRITRHHELSWWQRHFSDASLGGWEFVKDQDRLGQPPYDLSRNAVLVTEAGGFRKVADETKVKDLFDVPAEGLVYVGEPGIGVLQSIDLRTACP